MTDPNDLPNDLPNDWDLDSQYEDRWALLVSPDKLTLTDVYQRFAFAPAPQSVLATKIEEVVDRGLAMSLTDYFAEAQANRNKVSST